MSDTETFLGFGGDCINPVWDEAGRVHDWRNYISEELQEMWHTFSPEQKAAIARNAEEAAGREEWD